MNRKSIWIGVGMLAMLTLASAVAFADFGSGGGARDFDIDRDKPGPNCICPANYAPVVCRAADGSHTFSNLCVAGCSGFSASSCTAIDDPISDSE